MTPEQALELGNQLANACAAKRLGANIPYDINSAITVAELLRAVLENTARIESIQLFYETSTTYPSHDGAFTKVDYHTIRHEITITTA